MFGWLKKKRPQLEPEAKWVVVVDEVAIRVTDDTGATKALSKSELSGVIIETNDTGPWGTDVWWLLFGANDQIACTFPQGATGESAMIDYLSALPSFDHGEMIKAMRSTSNAVFPVWRRST